jgi:hypothetical protein
LPFALQIPGKLSQSKALKLALKMQWYLLPLHVANHFAISIFILHSAFHILSNTIFRGAEPKKLKQRCWILTTVNGGVMTLVSIPYLVDLLGSGFDFHAIQTRTTWLAQPFSCFFVAYLISDLGLGSIYYRKLINLSSGWIHHTVYTFLFAYWLHRGWSHIAVMACIFEVSERSGETTAAIQLLT